MLERQVYDLALRAVRDPDRAADVLIETFVRMGRRPRRFAEDVRAYSYGIATSIIVDELRKLAHVAPFEQCVGEQEIKLAWARLTRDPGSEPTREDEEVAESTWNAAALLTLEEYCLLSIATGRTLTVQQVTTALGHPERKILKRIERANARLQLAVRLELLVRRGARRCKTMRAIVEGGGSKETVLTKAEAHARSCALCSAEAERTTRLVAGLGDLLRLHATPCVREEILRHVNEKLAREQRPLERLLRRFAVGAAAVVLLAGGALVWKLTHDGPVVDGPTPGDSSSPIQLGKPDLEAFYKRPVVVLRWTIPRDGSIDDFLIERAQNGGDFQEIATPSEPSFIDKRVEPGSTYRYRVAARGAGGQGDFSNEAVVSVPQEPPGPPLNVAAIGDGCSVTITWSPPGSSPVTGYRITRVTTSSREPVGETADTQFTDSIDPDFSGQVRYEVVAFNDAGEGQPAGVEAAVQCIG